MPELSLNHISRRWIICMLDATRILPIILNVRERIVAFVLMYLCLRCRRFQFICCYLSNVFSSLSLTDMNLKIINCLSSSFSSHISFSCVFLNIKIIYRTLRYLDSVFSAFHNCTYYFQTTYRPNYITHFSCGRSDKQEWNKLFHDYIHAVTMYSLSGLRRDRAHTH